MDAREIKRKTIRRMVQILITTSIQAAMLFIGAGTLRWSWGWGFVAIYFLGIAINALFLYRVNPALIAERADKKDMKDWDKVVGGLFAISYFIALPLVSGLDTRFAWGSTVTLLWHLLGVAVFLVGAVLFCWSMAANAHFATVVRVGKDGEHQVATDGPYRIVRHPGYLGACLQAIGTPLILGAWWGFVPAGLAILFLIIRTALEDRTLQAELAGYEQLVAQTRYKLLPGIW